MSVQYSPWPDVALEYRSSYTQWLFDNSEGRPHDPCFIDGHTGTLSSSSARLLLLLHHLHLGLTRWVHVIGQGRPTPSKTSSVMSIASRRRCTSTSIFERVSFIIIIFFFMHGLMPSCGLIFSIICIIDQGTCWPSYRPTISSSPSSSTLSSPWAVRIHAIRPSWAFIKLDLTTLGG